MQTIIKQLKEQADFLAISLAYVDALSACSFVIGSGKTVTKVRVVDTGIIIFEPATITTKSSIKQIVISSGIHGNETAPIEFCNQLISDIINEKIHVLHRVMFIFGNPKAMTMEQRFADENLNSLFSGGEFSPIEGDSYECKRVKVIENAVADFYLDQPLNKRKVENFHYDLHTAIRESVFEKFAICPFLHNQKVAKEQLVFLQLSGVEAVLYARAPTRTFSYFSSCEFSAHSFTIELGKVRKFGDNNMQNFTVIVAQLTKLITTDDYQPTAENLNLKQFNIARSITKCSDNFSFNFAKNIANFTYFDKGSPLVTDGDIKVLSEGEAILFPNDAVPIGQRALLLVKPLI